MPLLFRPLARTLVPGGLIGWWTCKNFNYQSGLGMRNLVDASGFSNMATLQGSLSIPSVPGIARPYDGNTRTAAKNTGAGFTCGTKSLHYQPPAYTYIGWGFLPSLPASAGVLMSQANNADATNMRGCIQVLSSGKLRCQVLNAGVDLGYNGTGSHTIATNRWYHYAMTASATAVIGYVNAELDGSGTGGTIPTSSYPLLLADHGFQVSSFSFPGTVDDFRIYNRALSPGEIRTIMSEAFLQDNDTNFQSLAMAGDAATAAFMVPSQAVNMRQSVRLIGY